MKPETVHLLCFSPTGTTRTVLNEIATGFGGQIGQVIDITDPEVRKEETISFGDEPVLIGAPVYAGRLPKQAVDFFKEVKANQTPAVVVVLYGNREYEDALLELVNMTSDCGFIPLAAGAFIGEHSFDHDDLAIARNRPDEKDQEKARMFGKQISVLLDTASNIKDMAPVKVPGNFPYKDGMNGDPFSFIHVTDTCDDCGICVTACPNYAIDENNSYRTIEEQCIHCCACIKECPLDARVIMAGPVKEKARWLSEHFAIRKEPETFM